MDFVKLIILDGGGTIWYSMDVLWEHYQAAFSYFGLLRPDSFEKRFPFKWTTAISSLRSFNSRKNIPLALLAMYFCDIHPKQILARTVKGHEGKNPEECLHDLVSESWNVCTRASFEYLSSVMGEFLAKALYNYNDTLYPLCVNVIEGLHELRKHDYHLAMISNRKKASTKAILRNKKVAELIDYIEAPEDEREPVVKPIGKILDKYEIPKEHPASAIFIGDSNLDITSAQAFNLFTIAVTTGMGTPEVLKLDKPGAIVEDLVEAAKIIEEFKNNLVNIYNKYIEKNN
jgi:phosphoglycolate phosphatase-like HAD superfamily hydrolase